MLDDEEIMEDLKALNKFVSLPGEVENFVVVCVFLTLPLNNLCSVAIASLHSLILCGHPSPPLPWSLGVGGRGRQ